MKKIKTQDLKFGDYADELGLIKNTRIDGDDVLLEALPMHLEYYGLESSGKVKKGEKYNVHDVEDTIRYIFHCVVSLSRAREDCKNAEYKFIKWEREHNNGKHNILNEEKKLKKVKKNEVVEDYGLILSNHKSKLFGKKAIKMLGKSFKIFSPSTMFSMGDNGNGFDEIVKIINNDDTKITEFIFNIKQEIIDTNELITQSIDFLYEVILMMYTKTKTIDII